MKRSKGLEKGHAGGGEGQSAAQTTGDENGNEFSAGICQPIPVAHETTDIKVQLDLNKLHLPTPRKAKHNALIRSASRFTSPGC